MWMTTYKHSLVMLLKGSIGTLTFTPSKRPFRSFSSLRFVLDGKGAEGFKLLNEKNLSITMSCFLCLPLFFFI
jgi:hypothetical protein